MTLKLDKAWLAVQVSSTDHSQGPDEAPVTLVEYGDYECSSCSRAYQVVKELQRHLGHELRFVFRHFPLVRAHRYAELAAQAAEAAGALGHFWAMHDMQFENQHALRDVDVVRYAVEIGLDEARFVSEITEGHHAERIRNSILGGTRSGVKDAPTFFINGARHDGPLEFDTLLELIENELVLDVQLAAT